MESIIQLFKALSDETRLKILVILTRRKICAKGIARHLDISEAAVSQHLKILKDTGIIVGEKVGYFVLYRLEQSILLEGASFLNEIANGRSDSSEKLELHIPVDCKAVCKGSKSRCCHNNK